MMLFIASTTPHHLIFPVVPILGLRTNFKIRPRVSLILVKRGRGLKETRTRSGISCKGYSDSEAELALEREILNFMKNSSNPNEFPTEKQLLNAGRVDLVDGISKTGGWLALGWDYSDDENDSESDDLNDKRELQTRVESFQQRQDPYGHSSSFHTSSHQPASPSGRSLETEADGDTGVEGILSRLKKHRSLTFDTHMEKNTHYTYPRKQFLDFQPAEIDYRKEELKSNTDLQVEDGNNRPDDIRSRLKEMQLELSSALGSLQSKSHSFNSKVDENSSSELQHLSDVWEFQETELMKAEDKLRSIRAKLAVFEGKIALSVIDTQKLVEEKQRRINSARKTLQLLRTASIFWTHSASQVLLVGSFDGWTSQIKMEKTRTGIFSTSLKLYPGRYEIKFIVDGIWRVDPMLPIVHNNGYENNSLIVHERSS